MQRRIDVRHALEFAQRAGEQLQGPLAGLGRDRLGACGGRRLQPLGRAEAVALRVKVCLLLLARRGSFDLLELEGEQVELALARSRHLLQAREAPLELASFGVRRDELFAQGRLFGAAVRVQQLELRSPDRQLAVLVLTVESEQLCADLAQLGDSRRAPAEVGSSAAIGPHSPRQYELVRIRRETIEYLGHGLGYVRRTSRPRRQREDALDVCLVCARPHDPATSPSTEQQLERVGEDRLARAGLAGEDVEALSEAQLRPLEEQQVLDAQLFQHGHGVPGEPDGSSGAPQWRVRT